MSVRSYFFDEDDALLVAAQLRVDGFEAAVERGHFAGEDDDEDQPWILTTDAPDPVVELAAEGAGGWVEYDDLPDPPAPDLPAPLPLPTEPIRPRAD